MSRPRNTRTKTYMVSAETDGGVIASIDVNLRSTVGRQRMQKFLNLLQKELTLAEVGNEDSNSSGTDTDRMLRDAEG